MSLRKKTISGLFWSALSQGGKQVSQFVITAILARLLSPADFGLVAMATVFTGFAMIFGELGISSALIQKQDLDEDHWSSAFWLNLLVGFFLAIIFYFSAPFIALFYKKPELVCILQVLSINFILVSFAIIQQTILTKEMNFRSLMVRDIFAVLVSGVLGIVLALRGWGVWSLIVQTLTFSIVNGLLLWILSKWRPKFIISLLAIRDIFHFSANMTGFQIVNYFGRNIDQLLIGKFLGTQALGYYSLAYKLMLLPLQNISWVISRVMFPAFSSIQNNIEKSRLTYLSMIKAVSLVALPLMFCMLALAAPFIKTVLGEQWMGVVLILKILCFCGMIQSVATNMGNVIMAQGRADLQFKLGTLGMGVSAISVFCGIKWGIVGVAVSYTIGQFIWLPIAQGMANALIEINWNNFLKAVKDGAWIGLVLCGALAVFEFWLQGEGLFLLLIKVLLAGFLWAFLIFKFEKDFLCLILAK
jgi:O-antigen/teichoic acid export membrane protein